MKKIAFTIILLSSILVASAQKSMVLSFTASPSLNWMSSDAAQISRGKTVAGFDFGVNADFYFDNDNRYAITTGLLVNNTGGELDFNYINTLFAGAIFPSGTSIQYHLQYLEVPLALKLNTSQRRRSSYWAQFGFNSYINIKAKGSSSDHVLDKSNINEEVGLFNLGMNIGVGTNYDLGGNNSLEIGLIYKNGFTDITTNEFIEDEKTTLNSLTLKLGLVF